MVAEYSEVALYTQLKYLQSLFDVSRMQEKKKLPKNVLKKLIHEKTADIMNVLNKHTSTLVDNSAYNWIRPSLWSLLFGDGHHRRSANSTGTGCTATNEAVNTNERDAVLTGRNGPPAILL